MSNAADRPSAMSNVLLAFIDVTICVIENVQQCCLSRVILPVCRLVFVEILGLGNLLTKSDKHQPLHDFRYRVKI